VSEHLTLTVEEAAKLLGVGRGTAYEAVRQGEIPAIRIGRRVLVPRARLFELLGESEIPAALPDDSDNT
jgi:excisionase family DNA binding protein